MDKLSLKEKLKGIKHKEIVFAVLAVLIMLVIYFSSYLKTDVKNEAVAVESDYCTEMQARLTEAVTKLSGDSGASVVVNWESSVEKIIAYTENSSSKAPTVVQSGPIVLKTLNPKVVAVAVIIKSGDTALRLDVMQMVSTLLDISPEKVAVYTKK